MPGRSQRLLPNLNFTSYLCDVKVSRVIRLDRKTFFISYLHEDAGVQVENTSSVSPACHKRRLNGAMCRNHRIKRVFPCRCMMGTLKNPAKCLWRWDPDRRYNFFLVRLHIRAVTYMTEISLNVTLNNNKTQI